MSKISKDKIFEKTILYFECPKCGCYSEVNGGEDMSIDGLRYLDEVFCENCGEVFELAENEDEWEEEEEDE